MLRLPAYPGTESVPRLAVLNGVNQADPAAWNRFVAALGAALRAGVARRAEIRCGGCVVVEIGKEYGR